MSKCWSKLIPTPWAMPAPWCCIRMAPWKASTTRAPMAAPRACDCGLLPARVVAPAWLFARRRGEQHTKRKANPDAECHHRFRMPADLLADHIVEVGGAVLHAGQRVPGVVRGTVIDVGGSAFRLLIDAFGLLAGLCGSFVDRPPALLHRGLEIRIRHLFLRRVAGSVGKLVRMKRVALGPRPPCRASNSRGSASNPPQSVLWSQCAARALVFAMTRLFCRLVLAALVFFAAAEAQAHPHVWVKMNSVLVYGADGTVAGVRHAWTF